MYKKQVERILKKYSEEHPQCNLSSEGTHIALAKYIVDELEINDFYIMSNYDCEMLKG